MEITVLQPTYSADHDKHRNGAPFRSDVRPGLRATRGLRRRLSSALVLWLAALVSSFLVFATPAHADGQCPPGDTSPSCEIPQSTCDDTPGDPDCDDEPDPYCEEHPEDPSCIADDSESVDCNTPADAQIDPAAAAASQGNKNLLRALGIALRVCIAIALPAQQNCAPIYRGCLSGCIDMAVQGLIGGNSGIRACTRACMESYGCYDY